MISALIASEDRIRPYVAWKSVKRLISDPTRTEEVFIIIDALKGNSVKRAVDRLSNGEEGRALLLEKPSIVNELGNLEFSSGDSLGSFYREFIHSESISAEELINESEVSTYINHKTLDERWMGERLRDIHDLFHVVTRYGRDELGELCLLAYTNTLHFNRGIALILFMGRRQYRRDHPHIPIDACLGEARMLAKNSAWLPGIWWEKKLYLSIDNVRESLGLADPTIYFMTRSKIDQGLYG